MEDEIKHYGVIGMKWGVRRNPSKAFAKSSMKADKLNTRRKKDFAKSQVTSAKSSKAFSKIAVAQAKGADKNKIDKLTAKYEKTAYKNQKASRESGKSRDKADRWIRSMSRSFRKVNVSQISEKDLEIGKNYVYMLRNDPIFA